MRVLPFAARVYIGVALVVSVAAVTTLASTVLGFWAGLVIGGVTGALLFSAFHVADLHATRSDRRRERLQQWSDLHLATLETLALAIDARDQISRKHSRIPPRYVAALAKAVGMADADVQGLRVASLLVDVGKLAVPDQILSKSGPLTQEEFQKLRTHPQVGADVIAGVPFPYPVAQVIRSHHERWDGNGYPAGLEGEEIPLGARILSVVDYFEGLISERPPHRALSTEAALGLLKKESGKALDPRVVQTFVDLYPTLDTPTDAHSVETVSKQAERSPFDGGASRASVLQGIALAHREIHGLYEIAQAVRSSLGVADTMALISSKVGSLVPFSACALFLRGARADSLRCAFASGIEADAISTLTMRIGQGLTGWVVRTRRSLLNGRPRDDMDAAGRSGVETALQSALVSPLLFDGRCIGTLALYHVRTAAYDDEHRRLLERIAEQTAAVIHRSLVFEQTQEDSLTDALTGLPNTRFMLMHVERELARASRLRTEVSLLVMDLDDFKDINDTFGHHAGDRALKAVGGALRGAIRPYDVCARYAGDEFVAVLSGCGADEAERKRTDVQAAVAGLWFEPRPGERRLLTVSVGAAVYPRDGDDHEVLLAAADSRMYRDKTRRKRQDVDIKDGTTGAA
jgi:diguanylate cyclase (GGDEF)-like protein